MPRTQWQILFFMVAASVGVLIWDSSSICYKMSAGYQNGLFALLAASVSLLIYRILLKGKSWINYPTVCIPYILAVFPFVFSEYIPAGDSHTYYFPAFNYIVNAFTDGHCFPQWFPTSGGVRMGVSHIVFIPSIPHRILGYLFAFLTHAPELAYKLGYVSGVILMCYGWWLVLKRLTSSSPAAFFGIVMIMMGGTGITFHQEHVLGSTYLIPWFVLSILMIKDNTRYIFPALIILGLGSTTWYPQIEYISMGLFALIMALFFPTVAGRVFREQRKSTFILLILFILALLPAIYLLLNINNLSSSIRTVSPQTYPEYLEMNRAQQSSAIVSYFNQYLMPVIQAEEIEGYGEMPDRCSFFVGRIALAMALLGCFLKPRKAIPIIILLICFILLSLGINSPLPFPKLFFLLRFPTIDVFRQWVHFFPMVNFCISALAAIGLAGLFRFRRGKLGMVVNMLIPVLLFLQIADLTFYSRKYIAEFRESKGPATLESQFFSGEDYSVTRAFQYTNRYRLFSASPHGIPDEAFLTTEIVAVSGGEADELENVVLINNAGRQSTVVNTMPSEKYTPEVKISRLPCSTVVGHQGISVLINSPAAGLLVTPLNYDLNPTAVLDGTEVQAVRANSALVGVFVSKGIHRLELNIPWDIYWPLVWIQWLLYFSLMIFFIVLRKIPEQGAE